MAGRGRSRPVLRVIEGGVPLSAQLTRAMFEKDPDAARARMRAVSERMRACRPRLRLVAVDGRRLA